MKPLPRFLPAPKPAETIATLITEAGRASRGRDAAVADLQGAHKALDGAGVPRRVGGRSATVEERVRALLAGLEVTRPVREALDALSRSA